jgi:hypothetical protein
VLNICVSSRLLRFACFGLPSRRNLAGCADITLVYRCPFHSGLARHRADSIRVLRRQRRSACTSENVNSLYIEDSSATGSRSAAGQANELMPMRVQHRRITLQTVRLSRRNSAQHKAARITFKATSKCVSALLRRGENCPHNCPHPTQDREENGSHRKHP